MMQAIMRNNEFMLKEAEHKTLCLGLIHSKSFRLMLISHMLTAVMMLLIYDKRETFLYDSCCFNRMLNTKSINQLRPVAMTQI